jgi:hypothetical protein
MSELYNVGKDVISAYLSGLQHKERREALVNQALYRQQQMQIAQEKMDDARKKFEQEHGLELKKAASDADFKKAQIKNWGDTIQLNTARFFNNPGVTTPDGRRIKLNLPGQEQPIELLTGGERSQQKADEAGLVTGAQEGAKIPFDINRIQAQSNATRGIQMAHENWLATENKLNRESALERAKIHAEAVASNKAATKEDRQSAATNAADLYAPDVMSAKTAIEDLPSKNNQVGLDIHTQILGRGIKGFNRKDIEKFKNAQPAYNFVEKIKNLNEAIRSGNIGNYAQQREDLLSDLAIFARSAKEETGVLSNPDIDRAKGAIPSMFPGGALGIFANKQQENDRRVKEIENVIYGKIDNLMSGVNPVQRKAIMQQWNLKERPVGNKDSSKNGSGNNGAITNDSGRKVRRME